MNDNIFLNNYKERSIYDSNFIEFWAPVTNRLIPDIIPNRYYISTFGRTYNNKTKRPIGLSMHRKGYIQFSVMTTDQRQVTKKLHRMIMFTFCYFPGCEKYEVNHIDGIKTNNNITNLEWCTSSENTIHAINNVLKTVFGYKTSVVLTDDDITKIIYLYDNCGMSSNEIFNYLKIDGVSKKVIENICNRKIRLSYFNKNWY